MRYARVTILHRGKEVKGHPWNKAYEEGIPVEGNAKVKYSLGITLGIGDFQTARVDVGIELPCKPGEVDAKYSEAQDWVAPRFQEEIGFLNDLKKAIGGK